MRKGFSLIEIMVAMALIALMVGFGVNSTFRSNEQKKISESAEMVRQYFMEAKSLAQSGRKDCAACGSTDGVCGNGDVPLSGWRTTVAAVTPVTVEIHGECGATNFFSSGTKLLPDRIVMTLTGAGNVIFYPLNKGTNLVSTTTIRLNSITTGLVAKTFTISPQGEISSIY